MSTYTDRYPQRTQTMSDADLLSEAAVLEWRCDSELDSTDAARLAFIRTELRLRRLRRH